MRGFKKRRLLPMIALAVAMLPIFGTYAHAQAPAPDWQTAAGGKMAFDVASVKPGKLGGKAMMNFPLGPGDLYTDNGGVFQAANQALIRYIAFAYQLSPDQQQVMLKQMPAWVATDTFDIQAKSDNTNPTKDQMRLMMQALLADRFKLTVQHEQQEVSVFNLVLAKKGKLGPQLKVHPADAPPCGDAPVPAQMSGVEPTSTAIAGGLPSACDYILPMPSGAPDLRKLAARDIPMSLIASSLIKLGNLDRPVFDQTGLSGTYDFTLEFSPEFTGSLPPGVTAPEPSGPPFSDALTEQLGLKLVPQKGQVDALIVSHIEHPSAN